jgi:phytol kinase
VVKNPWIGIGILVPSLVAMLVALRALRARYVLHPEISRKVAHVGLGLATLSFPLLFESVWPVALLGLLTVLVLAAMRWLPALRCDFGEVVHGVERRSGGEFYFPIAAAALFVVTKGDPILFGIPILTLALADAVAAVVGVSYGRIRYQTGEHPKTLEGSVAFFTVAFLATHIPLLLFTPTGRLESILIGLTFGMLVMLLEAVSLRGTDNLLIPFGGYALLDAFLHKSALELAATFAVTTVFLVVVLAFRKQRTLSDTAMLAGVLVGFVSWSVGGWRWVVPPLVLFLSYTVLWPRRRLVRQRPHDVVAVGSVVSSGLLWLMLAHLLERPDLFYPYTISFAAHLCFIGVTWHRIARPQLHPLSIVVRSALAAWVASFPAYALVAPAGDNVFPTAAAALLWLVAGGAAFTYLVPFRRGPRAEPFPWLRQSLLGLAASALGLILLPTPGGLR